MVLMADSLDERDEFLALLMAIRLVTDGVTSQLS